MDSQVKEFYFIFYYLFLKMKLFVFKSILYNYLFMQMLSLVAF